MMTTTCSPRFSTARTPSRPTLGPRAASLAEAILGIRLMPWQRYVLDVALEYDPLTRRLFYREVGLTIPRQSGKSTLILVLAIHRALDPFFAPRQRIVYAAQTGKDAKAKWLHDYVEMVRESPRLTEGRDFTVHLGSGDEHLRFPKRRGRFAPTASTKKSGHGQTLDLGFVDEAFAQVDDRLEQAFKPAMITRPSPQTWVVSTAGDSSSVYLAAKVKRGRELAQSLAPTRIAYFEWSAPEGSDPTDREVWRACMPALGHTIELEAIEADFESMDLGEFMRAYLNMWVDGRVTPVLDPGGWAALAGDPSDQIEPPFAYAIDVTPLRSHAALTVCGRRVLDGIPQVEVIQHSPGTSWVVPRLLDVMERNGTGPVAIHAQGPAASLLPELEAAGIKVTKAQTSDVAAACGLMFDAFVLGSLRHLADPALDLAVAGGVKRSIGPDGAWVWDRRDVNLDISRLVSVTLAHWLLLAQPHHNVADSIW